MSLPTHSSPAVILPLEGVRIHAYQYQLGGLHIVVHTPSGLYAWGALGLCGSDEDYLGQSMVEEYVDHAESVGGPSGRRWLWPGVDGRSLRGAGTGLLR